MTHEINYKGIDIIVQGTYSKGSPRTYDYPGDNDKFEIEHVCVDSETNVLDITFDGSEIEALILERCY